MAINANCDSWGCTSRGNLSLHYLGAQFATNYCQKKLSAPLGAVWYWLILTRTLVLYFVLASDPCWIWSLAFSRTSLILLNPWGCISQGAGQPQGRAPLCYPSIYFIIIFYPTFHSSMGHPKATLQGRRTSLLQEDVLSLTYHLGSSRESQVSRETHSHGPVFRNIFMYPFDNATYSVWLHKYKREPLLAWKFYVFTGTLKCIFIGHNLANSETLFINPQIYKGELIIRRDLSSTFKYLLLNLDRSWKHHFVKSSCKVTSF